jgi:ABC-2 type transport system ATP-binding protein
MDPQARQVTWEFIRTLRRNGVTILLTTHFMDEAERLADRVAIIDQGHLVALDTPRSLIQGRQNGATAPGARGLRFTTQPGLDLPALRAALEANCVREEEPGRYLATVEPSPRRLARLAAWLGEQDALLTDLRIGHRTLEDVFLSLTGHQLRD